MLVYFPALLLLVIFHALWAMAKLKLWTMMTSSNGNIFRVTGPLCGEFTGPREFPTQRPVTRSFDVFLDLRLNKRLSKQPWGWWFETPPRPLWRQCNVKWRPIGIWEICEVWLSKSYHSDDTATVVCLDTGHMAAFEHILSHSNNICIYVYICIIYIIFSSFRTTPSAWSLSRMVDTWGHLGHLWKLRKLHQNRKSKKHN